jgi:hypothetical protein
VGSGRRLDGKPAAGGPPVPVQAGAFGPRLPSSAAPGAHGRTLSAKYYDKVTCRLAACSGPPAVRPPLRKLTLVTTRKYQEHCRRRARMALGWPRAMVIAR